jgi:hypothetical protein
MVTITHTSPKYNTYQANLDYLSLLNIEKYLFLNIDSIKISIPLEKKKIQNGNDFDLITPINFQRTIGSNLKNKFDSIIKLLKETGAVCLYIQTKDNINFEGSDLINFEKHRTNYYINLKLSEDELMKLMKRDARQRLKKINKNIKYEISTPHTSDEFIKHYTRISEVNNFTQKYRFTSEQLIGFSKITNINYIELKSEGDFIAGGLFGVNDDEVDYLYGANNPKFVDSIRLLIWNSVKYFKGKGCKKLFLGGGISEGDSLSYFKSRIGTYEQRCQTIMAILNKEKAEFYAKKIISNEWFHSFFPIYQENL